MQEDPVAVATRGYVDVAVGAACRNCVPAGVLTEERHDLPHRHEERGAGPDRCRQQNRVDLPAVSEEVGAGGDVEEVAVTVDRVQDPGVGDSGGPGGKEVSAVASGQSVVAFGHRETLAEGTDLLRHPGKFAVHFCMGLHQRSPGGVRIATVVEVAERPAAAVGGLSAIPKKRPPGCVPVRADRRPVPPEGRGETPPAAARGRSGDRVPRW